MPASLRQIAISVLILAGTISSPARAGTQKQEAKSKDIFDFRGTLIATDPAQGKFIVSSLKKSVVMWVDNQTRIVVRGKPAGLKSATLGEEANGFGTFENGKFVATIAIFRAKNPAQADQIPYGIKVSGFPTLAISPYSPDAGPIDVNGHSRGDKVKDPYTNKIFLVP